MKQYVSSNQLRLVGKGWEVRHQLRKLAAASSASITRGSLARFTDTVTARRQPVPVSKPD